MAGLLARVRSYSAGDSFRAALSVPAVFGAQVVVPPVPPERPRDQPGHAVEVSRAFKGRAVDGSDAMLILPGRRE